ncbi:MAG: radical SAM protein [bacterium]
MHNATTSKKALLRLGYSCNNICVFCHSRSNPPKGPDLSGAEALRRIDILANAGFEMVVFTGGEPTIRNDFFQLCGHAAGLGMKCGMISNGRMLYYGDFAERVAEKMDYIILSLHGASEATHNLLTGQKSFQQTLAGLVNISSSASKPSQMIVNTVLTRLNQGELSAIHRLLESFSPLLHKISLPEPKGAFLSNPQLALSPKEAAAVVRSFLDNRRVAPGISIGFDGFTPCLLDDFQIMNNDFFTHNFLAVFEPGEDKPAHPDHGSRVFLRSCLSCSRRHLCAGIYSEYLKIFPDTALEPVIRAVSNSVRFDYNSTVPYPADFGTPACKMAGALLSTPPNRNIAVKSGNRLKLYNTHEADTCHAELQDIKFRSQQVYSCGDAEPSGMYFPLRMKKLNLSRKCAECARLTVCSGVFAVSKDNVFGISIEKIRYVLSESGGRTLEIGCGYVPFIDVIKDAVDSGGIISYLGIDPDLPHSADSLSAKTISFRKTSIEAFKWSGPPFDTVILLRSYHHIKDLEKAMSVIVSITKPGSALMITDDARHIQLFDGGHDAAQREKPAFEHFRCHSAWDAVKMLELHGFGDFSVADASPETAMNWFVKARRL